MIKRYLGISLLATSVLVAGCSSDDDDDANPVVQPPVVDVPYDPPATATGDLIQTATDNGSFVQFLAAVESAGLTATFQDAATVHTIFAPTDAAFDALETATPGALAALTADELLDLLQYHVNDVVSAIDSAAAEEAATAGTSLTMLNGKVAAVTGTVATGLQIGGSVISAPDLFATNGILHGIDTVLTVPADVVVPPTPPVNGGDNIVAELESRGYAALVQLIADTGFTDTFAGPNNDGTTDLGWTMFAPSDTALAAADLGSLPAADQALALRRHVISGIVGSADLTDGTQAMNAGSVVVVGAGTAAVTVGGASITEADIIVGNGVIHLVDSVLQAAP